jgi:hypothetical protein
MWLDASQLVHSFRKTQLPKLTMAVIPWPSEIGDFSTTLGNRFTSLEHFSDFCRVQILIIFDCTQQVLSFFLKVDNFSQDDF